MTGEPERGSPLWHAKRVRDWLSAGCPAGTVPTGSLEFLISLAEKEPK